MTNSTPADRAWRSDAVLQVIASLRPRTPYRSVALKYPEDMPFPDTGCSLAPAATTRTPPTSDSQRPTLNAARDAVLRSAS